MKTKKYIKRRRICKFIIFLILVGLGYVTYLFINSPKFKMIQYLYQINGTQPIESSIYQKLTSEPIISTSYRTHIESVKYNMDIIVDTTYQEDNNKKKNYLKFDISDLNKRKSLGFTLFNQNNKLYYTINNVFKNYYSLDSKFYALFKSNTFDKNVKMSLITTVLKTLSNEKFSESIATDIINNNEATLNKYSFKFNNNDIRKFLNDFRSELSKKEGNYNHIINNIDSVSKIFEGNNGYYIYSIYESNEVFVKQDIQYINNSNENNIVFTIYDYDNKSGIKISSGEDVYLYLLKEELTNDINITGNILNYNIDGNISISRSGDYKKLGLEKKNIEISAVDDRGNTLFTIDGTTSDALNNNSGSSELFIGIHFDDGDIGIDSDGYINNNSLPEIDSDNIIDNSEIMEEDKNALKEHINDMLLSSGGNY